MRTLLLVVALAGAGMGAMPVAAQEGLMAESPVDAAAAIDAAAEEERADDAADDAAIDEAAAAEAVGDAEDDQAIAGVEAEETGQAGPGAAVRAAAEENAEPDAPREEALTEPFAAPTAAATDAPSAEPSAASGDEPYATRVNAVDDTPAAPTVVLETLTVTDDTPSQVELTFSDRVQRPTATAIGGEAGRPQRIVVDFPATKLGGAVPSSSPGRGRVLQVRAGQYKPDVTRVVLELAEPWPTRVRLKKDRVVIQLEETSLPAR